MRAVHAAIIALAGCASRTVAVAPTELARNAAELARDRRAVVYTLDGKSAEVRANAKLDIYLRDGDVRTPVKLTVGELVAGCERDVDAPDCKAARAVGEKAIIRIDRSLDSDLVAKGVGFAAIGGLVGYCLAACQDESSVPRALGYTALAIGGVAVLFIGALALGGRD